VSKPHLRPLEQSLARRSWCVINPSALRTAYVAAYLQLSAPEDISGILGPVVPGYDAQAVKDIIKAQSNWSALSSDDSRGKELKAAYQRRLQGCPKIIA